MTTAETRLARSATQAANSSCSTFSWRPASIVRRRSVPATPAWVMLASSSTGRPVASRSATTTWGVAGERRLVRLLDPVLADALTIDEAEEIGRKCRLRTAARPAGRPARARTRATVRRRASAAIAARTRSASAGSSPWREDHVLAGRCQLVAGRPPLVASSRPRIWVRLASVVARFSAVSWSGAATSR